jgi:hypothetical protein
MAADRNLIPLIQQQVRLLVDPMIMRLRTELFQGNVYYPQFGDSLIPTTVIAQGVQDGINKAVELGGLVPAYYQLPAGAQVQTGKVVYFNGTNVFEADPSNIAHAGKVIGVASTPGNSGELINVQVYGILTTDVYSFASVGTVFVGTSSWPSLTIPSNAAFIQPIGISLSGNRLLVLPNDHILVT